MVGPCLGIFMLVTGTLCTVTCKFLFVLKSEGLNMCKGEDGVETNVCTFNKPWFTVCLMKIAMSFCIVVHLISKPRTAKPEDVKAGLQAEGRNTQLVSGDADSPTTVAVPTWGTIGRIALPSALDLTNVVLSNIGLVWVSSSIYQMTRGSVVVFSAILSVQMLKRKLDPHQYWAVSFVVMAVILVGVAGIQASGAGSSSLMEVIAGLVLILLSQVVLAFQIVVEERMMTEQGVNPIQLVGYEGLWGLVYFVFLIPILTFTPGNSTSPLQATYHEDFRDSVVQVRNSTPVLLGCIAYCVFIALYNVAGQGVTKHLSAVLRSILEACRTLGVWIVDLVVFAVATGTLQHVGEKWTVWSWVELAGFALLVYGTMSYKGILPVPCARVNPALEEEQLHSDC